MPMRQVKTEAGTLTYELCRKRVKNLNLRVRADGSIAVSAPAGVTVAAVDEFVRRKARWVAQVEQKLADRRLPDPEYGALLGRRASGRGKGRCISGWSLDKTPGPPWMPSACSGQNRCSSGRWFWPAPVLGKNLCRRCRCCASAR